MSSNAMARRAAIGLAALVLLSQSGGLEAQDSTPATMTLVDLVELPSVGDPQISPDGGSLVFVRSDADWEANDRVSHVWRIDADGANALQLTRGDEGQSSPRWSPDGTRIAFLADRSDDDPRQIHLLRTVGGEAEQLTEHPTSVSNIQWSPDGRWIYFTASDEKSEEQKEREKLQDDVFAYDEDYQQRHLWRVDVESRETERVTEGDFSVRGYELSRDGAMIAHHRAPTPLYDDSDESEVWVMAADGSDAVSLTDNPVSEGGATLSPDNRWVAFTSGSSGDLSESYYNTNVYLVPAAGGEIRELAPGSGHGLNQVVWSDDGDALWVMASVGVRDQLFRLEVASGALERVTEGDHSLSSWSYHPGLDRHAFVVRTDRSPGEVFTLDAGDEPLEVTDVHGDMAARFRLPRSEAITWEGEDGVMVEGLLYYPLDYQEGRRYPLMVQTHGGPASADQFGEWSSYDAVPVYTGLGYFFLKPNYRGSTGYGDAFLRDMVGGYFRQAHLDVMAGVDHLIDEGLVDGERMGKFGWSAGGHMTNKIITHTDRFNAAASGAGAANWISMYAQSDVRIYRTPWFGGTPWEEDAPIEVFWEHSPLKDVSNVTTPTIFLVGQNDPRVPMPQSVEMWRGVQAQGVPTHLYVAPREGHGWGELRHQLFRGNVHLEWFQKWVMGEEWEWEKAPEMEKRKGN